MLPEVESQVAEASRVSKQLPIIYLARHGETAWTVTGQHTGRTDLPLTEAGERNARRLRERLKGLTFAKVFTSPLQRAVRTCELAGFGAVTEVDDDLVEWDYGEYEGLTTAEIRAKNPAWQLFRDGCPGGESPKQAAARADRVVSRVRAVQGDVLLFSSGHFISSIGCPLDWYRIRGERQVLHVEHSQSERVELRTRSLPAGDPAVERHSSCDFLRWS